MPTSKTKELAKKLGLLRSKRKLSSVGGGNADKRRRKGQVFSYLVVMDFESTCWENKKGQQEIIEFPAVLLDLANGEVVEEFQQYVLPVECPILSDFCKQLTGISQEQVDNGIPLPTCLYLFRQWIDKLVQKRGVVMMEPGQKYDEEMQLCSIVTWSDWDLGVCLHYECRRKQIRKPAYFNQWVNIRALYKTFYERKPCGVKGSLEDLGINFVGQEHSGIDDARNTAKLCYRMVRDGCKMNITKTIESKVSVIKPPAVNTKTVATIVTTSSNQTTPSSCVLSPKATLTSENLVTKLDASVSKENKSPLSTEAVTAGSVNGTRREDAGVCQSSAKDDRDKGAGVCQSSAKDDCDKGAGVCQGSAKDDRDNWGSFDEDFMKDILGELDNWDNTGGPAGNCTNIDGPAGNCNSENVAEHTLKLTERKRDFQPLCIQSHAPDKPVTTPVEQSSHRVANRQPQSISERTPRRLVSHIAPITLLPSSISRQTTMSRTASEARTNTQSNRATSESSCSPGLVETIEETPPSDKPAQPTNSTPNHQHTNTTKLNLSNNSKTSDFKTPSTAQWIKVKQSHSHSGSQGRHNRSSTPSNTSSEVLAVMAGHKVTPPMCECGRRTKRKCVSNPGPNEGKMFYVCPVGSGSNHKKGCGYFKWEVKMSDWSSLAENKTFGACAEYD